MATTDAKPGFRLPWSSDRSEAASQAETVADAPAADHSPQAQENETTDMIDAAPAAPDLEAAVDTGAAVGPATTAVDPASAATPMTAVPTAPTGTAARKPNKFMADLTRAMQAAAETAREESLAKLGTDAKSQIEGIHTTSAEEAAELRKKADDDVAAIRDWSKAEIARIREETDERIAHRKTDLEREIEEHAAYIERRIERVQARVDAYEAEMAAFFERLLAEEDPTRFAAMAESLPEPPSLDADAASAPAPIAVAVATPVVEAVIAPAPEPIAETHIPQPDAVADAPAVQPDAAVEPVAGPETAEATPWSSPDPEAPPADGGDLLGLAAEAPTGDTPAADPRIAMLGLDPDFAAAEAEAASFAPADASVDGSDEGIAEMADEAISARLAGLVPEADANPGEATATRVVVTGLISVASIAGFKRHLSRVAGVQSVGVSSGPDGEFVFAVVHGADLSLRDSIPTLPGFGARVTGEADGSLVVSAHDPEAEG